jgi:hypothetical protein
VRHVSRDPPFTRRGDDELAEEQEPGKDDGRYAEVPRALRSAALRRVNRPPSGSPVTASRSS